LRKALLSETDGRGVDIIMDTTGAPALLNEMISLLPAGGCLVIPAFYEQAIEDVHLNALIVKDCALIGSAGTAFLGKQILNMLKAGKVSLKPMITDRFSFERAVEGFKAMDERSASRVKIMIDF